MLSQPAAAREGARSCFILRIEVSVYEEINKILRTLHGPRTPLFRPPRTPWTPDVPPRMGGYVRHVFTLRPKCVDEKRTQPGGHSDAPSPPKELEHTSPTVAKQVRSSRS